MQAHLPFTKWQREKVFQDIFWNTLWGTGNIDVPPHPCGIPLDGLVSYLFICQLLDGWAVCPGFGAPLTQHQRGWAQKKRLINEWMDELNRRNTKVPCSVTSRPNTFPVAPHLSSCIVNADKYNGVMTIWTPLKFLPLFLTLQPCIEWPFHPQSMEYIVGAAFSAPALVAMQVCRWPGAQRMKDSPGLCLCCRRNMGAQTPSVL